MYAYVVYVYDITDETMDYNQYLLSNTITVYTVIYIYTVYGIYRQQYIYCIYTSYILEIRNHAMNTNNNYIIIKANKKLVSIYIRRKI